MPNAFRTAEALRLLGTWAATQDAAGPADYAGQAAIPRSEPDVKAGGTR
ncbi:hypothetical protein [Actinomadura livida]|uniref:Uncharacterized protein n=1 Tax=Actinomadura livida TaxID=79909 RepID=A0A7W7I7U6_9ACTN|nr:MULTISPECIES: hypothetical protein [Actinomadura]MBB4772122.1 hypothetical protein [Actinomadura catellatispora]GGU37487.1 hypothetical protein GCM10010208_72420 [Actinomadura livida]